jgi:hypothetical protein
MADQSSTHPAAGRSACGTVLCSTTSCRCHTVRWPCLYCLPCCFRLLLLLLLFLQLGKVGSHLQLIIPAAARAESQELQQQLLVALPAMATAAVCPGLC